MHRGLFCLNFSHRFIFNTKGVRLAFISSMFSKKKKKKKKKKNNTVLNASSIDSDQTTCYWTSDLGLR